jgi:HlyD family secretion protein
LRVPSNDYPPPFFISLVLLLINSLHPVVILHPGSDKRKRLEDIEDMEKKINKGKKSGRKWIFFLGIVVVLIGAAGYVYFSVIQPGTVVNAATYTTEPVQIGNLTQTVSATGNVYTRQSVSMNWKTSGTVSQVYVTKGQQVTEGTLLAELVPSSLPQDVINAAIDLATAQQALDDLLNSDTTRATAELTLVQAEQDLTDAQDYLNEQLHPQSSQQNIDIYYAELINAREALENAETDFDEVSGYAIDDLRYVNALSAMAEAQQNYYTAQANYESVLSIASTDDVDLANAELAVAEAKYLDAKRAWEAIKDGPVDTDVASAEAKVASAQAIMDKAYIYASISGTVTEIGTQGGDLVSENTAAFQIDDLSTLYVDISVSELDISKIAIGQPAVITLDAIQGKTYQGKVSDIDRRGKISSNAVSYPVTIELTNPDSDIQSGMTATTDIKVSEIQNVVLVPSSAIRMIDGETTLYLLQNGVLVNVIVTTGTVGDSLTQVTSSNLVEGDLIVVNPPSSTSDTAASSGMGMFGQGSANNSGAPDVGGN